MNYATAFEALSPNCIAMDMLLGLLLDGDACMRTGWHQIIKVREPDGSYFRTFDLIDGEDLGRSYTDRQFAKSVTLKARVHWARSHKEIAAVILARTGQHPTGFKHERDYFRAMSRATGYTLEVLRVLHSMHRGLVISHQLKEAA